MVMFRKSVTSVIFTQSIQIQRVTLLHVTFPTLLKLGGNDSNQRESRRKSFFFRRETRINTRISKIVQNNSFPLPKIVHVHAVVTNDTPTNQK